MESLVAFARTVFKCIANKQTNKQTDRQTDILLYIYRFLFFDTRHRMCSVYFFCSVPIIMCSAYSICFVCIIICVPSIPFIFFEYPKISCAQWQKAQVLVYFCSWIIEEAITRTNSLEKIFTIVNPTMGGANTPLMWKFCVENYPTTFRWSKGYSLQNLTAFAHTVSKCIKNKQTDRQTIFFIYIDWTRIFMLVRNIILLLLKTSVFLVLLNKYQPFLWV